MNSPKVGNILLSYSYGEKWALNAHRVTQSGPARIASVGRWSVGGRSVVGRWSVGGRSARHDTLEHHLPAGSVYGKGDRASMGGHCMATSKSTPAYPICRFFTNGAVRGWGGGGWHQMVGGVTSLRLDE